MYNNLQYEKPRLLNYYPKKTLNGTIINGKKIYNLLPTGSEITFLFCWL
jgi:hypothetical protein